MSALVVRGLTARLDGFALGPVDLEVPPGTALAVLGPSGAGKTTLLRAIAGFVPAYARELSVGGTPVAALPPEERRMGYVPQGLALFPHRTVEGNVAYPLEIRGAADTAARTRDLLDAWGLTRLARASVLSISGGEQQRTAMARALAAGPRLLLWDEPLAAVDALARRALIGSIRRVLQREGVSMLLVTHDAETAFAVADRFLVLDGGRALPPTTPARLVDRPPSRFAAELAGYDNVLAAEDLAGGPEGSLAAWLLARAGPGGIGIPSEAMRAAGTGGWSGRVVGRRERPGGREIRVAVDGLELRLFERGVTSAGNGGIGDALRFSLDEDALRPIGGAGEAGA